MGTIQFIKHDTNFILKDKLLMKTFLQRIFKEESVAFESVNYIFCSDDYLLQLNQQYLDHDTYTDILTFTLSDPHLPIISEIFISVDRVRENAKTHQQNFLTEMHRVMIHGVLHLCGFDDLTPELKEEMRKREDHYLLLLNQ